MKQTEQGEVPVPLRVRLLLGRAAVQVIAADLGVDLLHIKGNAVDAAVRAEDSPGSDIDVMVRPSQVSLLHDALMRHGWTVYSTFTYGSPFGHAQTYLHSSWGYLDLHRMFPGIGLEPEAAFEVLWRERAEREFAGIAAAVPALTAQAVLLVLNDVRSRQIMRAGGWVERPALDAGKVASLVEQLDARVAFSVATGTLERFRGERDYRLWKVITEGGTRTAEWWARIRAAPTLRAGAGIVLRAPLANVERLTHQLGRKPTRAEVLRATAARPVRAVKDLAVTLRRRLRS